MKRKITFLTAALALLAFLAIPLGMWGQTRDTQTVTYGWETTDDADPWTISDAIAATSGQGNTGDYAGKINTNSTTVQFNDKVYVTSFSYAFKRTSNNNNYSVYIETSTDGTNWSIKDTQAMSTFTNGTYRTVTKEFDGTQEVYVRFRCNNTTAVRYVDDVTITYATSAAQLDPCDLALTNASTSLVFDLYNNSEPYVINYTTSSTGEVTVSDSDYITAVVDQVNKTITVTPVAVTNGAKVITVNQAADDNYATGTKTFTINITDSTPFSGGDVTFDATIDKDPENTAQGEGSITKSGVTFACNNGILGNGSEYRMYKNSVTTFSVSDGAITQIVFTGTNGNPASGFGTQTGWTTDGNNGTWTGNAQEVSFTASGAQVRATTIVVTVDMGSTPDPTIAADNVEIAYDATSGSIAYTISNGVDGGTVTAATQSDWLTLSQGTASPIAFTCTANQAGTARTATVTLTYTYNRAAVTHDVTVTQTAAPVAYTTIPALFEAATSTETSVLVTFNNWVVSGISTNGKNVFVTDNSGNGFVIYSSSDMSSTYAVGNILSGTAVSCTLKKYNGFAELLNVNAADLTIGTGGTVTTANIALADLAGVNTGALLHYDNLTCNVTTNVAGTTSYYYLTDGTTSIQVYSALYAFGSLEHGKKYNITGIYQQYNDTKEILPRSVADIEEVVSAEPSVTISPATIDAPAEGASGTLTVTYEIITESDEDAVVFCDAAGAEATYGWITAELNSEHNSIEYIVSPNEGAARTAYFKVLAFDENLDDFFSNIVTVNQAEYVAPSYATLPFTFTGGKADIETTDGLTQDGLGNDYNSTANATTPLKFDSTDDWLLLQFNERPGTLTFDITGNGFSGSTFTVQTSEDGTTYTDLQAYTELGATQHEEFTNLGENVRYIKWIYTSKASGNVGLGAINLYKYGEGPVAEPSVTVTPATISAPAEVSTGTLAIAYENIPDLISFDYYFCNANGDELEDTDPNYPDWIDAAIEEENEVYSVAYSIHANEGAARTAYFKVYTTDTPNQEEVYAIVTVTQAEYVAPVLDYATLPFEFDGGRADIASTDGLTQDGLESDYADSPKLKFKNTGTWVILHFNERPGTLTFDIKGNSFSGGTFTVQTSEDGVTYTDLKNYTDTNFDNTLHSEEFTNLGENVRYIKWIYTNKASGNVGLGNIHLYKYGEGPAPVASITVNPNEINVDAEDHDGTLDLTYENLTITDMYDFNIQYYDAQGEEIDEPDWMEALVAEQDPEIGEGFVASYWIMENEGTEARTAYFKVYVGETFSNLVTVTQAAPVTPVTPSNYVRITSLDQLTEGCKVIIAARYDEGDATAYAAMTNATSGKPVGENFTSITSDGNEVLPSTITNNETEYYWTVNLTENGYTFTNTVGLMIGYSGSDTDFQSGGDHVEWTIERSTSEAGLMPNYTGFVITNHYSTNRAFAYNGAKFGAYAKSNMSGNYNFYLDFFVETLPANSIAIEGYANCENPYGGYYLIASPFTVAPASVPGMTQGNYDLYYFTDKEEAEWINYKNEDGTINEDFGPLTPGKGYLYAHETDVILTFDGEPYEGNGEVTLSLNANNTGSWKGWNLVGNPYTETAYIDRDFYVMNSEGSEFIEGSIEDGIAPMQGIFVIANYDEEPMTFSTTQSSEPTNGKIVMNVRKDRNMVVDRAMIRFGEGHQLPKLMLNPDNTKLYIDQNGEDFAVVRSIDENSTPVSFRAAENGTYTLSINAEEIEMEYLHLIDNMTGADIDLLATPSYTFEARTTDYTSRFNLVYATLTDVNENNVQPFAFYNGSEWVINNEGNATLQVIDVTGRVLSSETVNGNTRISLQQVPGVYVMRLVNGDNVKTQKVVVR